MMVKCKPLKKTIVGSYLGIKSSSIKGQWEKQVCFTSMSWFSIKTVIVHYSCLNPVEVNEILTKTHRFIKIPIFLLMRTNRFPGSYLRNVLVCYIKPRAKMYFICLQGFLKITFFSFFFLFLILSPLCFLDFCLNLAQHSKCQAIFWLKFPVSWSQMRFSHRYFVWCAQSLTATILTFESLRTPDSPSSNFEQHKETSPEQARLGTGISRATLAYSTSPQPIAKTLISIQE